MASLTSDNDTTNASSNPRRKTIKPAMPTHSRSSAVSMITRPPSRPTRPTIVVRSLPTRSAKAALPRLAVSSVAPNSIATAPIPPVDTPKASSSQLPDTTNTESPAIAVVAEPIITSHARAVIEVDRGAPGSTDRLASIGSTGSISGDGRLAGNVRATSNAASAHAIAIAANGPRQPNRLISTATIGAPASKAIAHEVSYRPNDLARQR